MHYVQRFVIAALVVTSSIALPVFCSAAAASSPPQMAISAVPLSFEQSAGGAGAPAEFVAHGPQYAIGLSEQGATLAIGSDVIRLQVQGARPGVHPAARQPLPGVVNYFIGNDPSRWRTGVKTFGQVSYAGVYRGVDLVYYGTQGRLEYDFSVAPGASTSPIRLTFEGADGVRVDRRGNLKVTSHGQEVVFERPVAYQLSNSRRTPVIANYTLDGDAIGFKVGAYDHRKALIIDPVLSYFSYLGGSGNDVAGVGSPSGGGPNGALTSQAAAVDAAGDMYVVGYTNSANFPVQAAYKATDPATANLNNPTAFVAKFAPDAKSLIFSTYLGGSNGYDLAYAVALDSSGNAFVVGSVASNDFPITAGAYQTLCSATYGGPNGTTPTSNCSDGSNNGQTGSFVSKFSPTGTLLASTFLGGEASSTAYAVAVDSAGRPYVAGSTYPGTNTTAAPYQDKTVGFPTTAGAVVTAYPYCSGTCTVNGALQFDAFVSVFDPALTTLVYSTLYGDDQGTTQNGNLGDTQGTTVTVDAAGNFYLAGFTKDAYLPVSSTALQPQITSCGVLDSNSNVLNGSCGFVAKFSAVGSTSPPTLTYGTYLGHMGSCCGQDSISSIAADSAGDAYVLGFTTVGTYPTTTGAYQTACNEAQTAAAAYCNSAYVSKLNPTGTTLLASTYFGGYYDGANNTSDNVATVGQVKLDGAGNVYLSGTASGGLPQMNALPTPTAGAVFPFVAELNSSLTALIFSSLIDVGSAGSVNTDGLSVDSIGHIYLAGSINSGSTSPATSGALQTTFGGGFSDAFVAKIALTTVTTSTLTASPTTATAGAAISFTATVAEVGASAVPTGSVTFKDGATTLGTMTLNATGVAVYTISTLAVGAHTVTAVYGGDAANSTSTSTAASVTVTAPPAPTVTLSAATASIVLGQSVALTWMSTNDTACTASGSWTGAQALSGSATVTPTAVGSASYVLTCTGAGGSANATAALTVTAVPAPTVTIAIAPASLVLGASATLTWTSTNATACTASGSWIGAEAVSGTATVTPTAAGALSYVLTCTGTGGSANATAALTVTTPAPTVTLSVSPTTITVGQSATLTWTSTNATACTASGAWSGTQVTAGSATESPATAGASSFTLTCTGSGGSGNATAALTVNAVSSRSGGGSVDPWELLGLAIVSAYTYRRRALRLNI